MTVDAAAQPDSTAHPDRRRVAIVTGGAGTLGSAIARRLALAGARVILVDLERETLDEAARTVSADNDAQVDTRISDISDDRQNVSLIEDVVCRYGTLDYLVNNAAVTQTSKTGAIQAAEWERVMAVNLWGPASLSQAAKVAWKDGHGGAIVNISSRTWLTGGPLSYVTSKAGLVGLTRSLAVELAPLNVRVNAVAPSTVQTEFVRAGRSVGEYERHIERHTRLPLLSRMATPDDVANAVNFLTSSQSAFITGEVIHVAGGAQLAPPP